MSSDVVDGATSSATETQAFAPRLRFSEFRDAGDWEQRPLGTFAELIDERVGRRPFTPLSITSGIGLVSQEEKFGRTIAGQQLKNYLVLRNGDFAYNKSATKLYPQGYAVMYHGDEPGCVPGSIFTCFRATDRSICNEFVNFLLSANLHGRWLSRFTTTGARANGSLNVDDDDLLALPVPLPRGGSKLPEQRKIANCLSSLDAVIAAEGERLAALRAHKKGLMQALFPVEGELTPRLRLPEFQGLGDWEQISLQKALAGPATYGIVKAGDYQATGVRMVRGGDIKGGIINKDLPLVTHAVHQEYRRTILRRNDILIALVGYPGEAAVVPEELAGSNVSRAVGLLRPSERVVPEFLASYLNSDKGRRDVLAPSAGSAQVVVNLAALNNLRLLLPKPAEQRRIAALLGAMNATIIEQVNRLASLGAHKSGLLQQLFPSPAQASK